MHLFVVSNKKATPSRELLLGVCGRISPARGGKLRLRTISIKKATPFRVLLLGACGRISPARGDKLRLRTSSIKKATPYRELLFWSLWPDSNRRPLVVGKGNISRLLSALYHGSALPKLFFPNPVLPSN